MLYEVAYYFDLIYINVIAAIPGYINSGEWFGYLLSCANRLVVFTRLRLLKVSFSPCMVPNNF